MPDRPPLADIDYTSAVEAAWEAIDAALTDSGIYGREVPAYIVDKAAAAAVDAVWPILHQPAYAAGRASVLEGSTEIYAVDAHGLIYPLEARYAAKWQHNAGSRLMHAWRTEWEPVEEVAP